MDTFSLFSFVRVAMDEAVEIKKERLPEVTMGIKEKENKEEIKVHNPSSKIAEQLGALAAPLEDMDLILSTYMAAHSSL